VTVRTNLDRFVGGAKEETIIARVGEGIVTTIGSAESYKHVLGKSRQHLEDRAGSRSRLGSAFEILSIDIADVDVARTWAQNCRWHRQRPTRNGRPRLKSAAPPPSRSSRK